MTGARIGQSIPSENVMYAVVSSGGKQYRVEPGTTLTMERIGAEAGAPYTFDRVLLIGDGDRVTVGTPVVSGATVSATVLGEELGPKLVIFKFKQKVKYRRRTGHRQHLVRVRIDAINADGESKRAKAEKAEEAPKAEKAEQAEAAPKAAKAPAKRAPRAKAASASKASTEEKPKATRKPRATKAKAEKPAEE
ncbi:MAG TPA: 50S ribosomal protein L21 [Candidatus Limnocylindria bacterium]